MKRRELLKYIVATPSVALLAHMPGSLAGERGTDNSEVAGSNPAPATINDMKAASRTLDQQGVPIRQPIYVMAGNYVEATDWMRSHGLLGKGMARYIFDHRYLQAVARGMKFVRVGTWHKRSDSWDIDAALASREAIEVSPITGDFAWYVQGDKSWRGRVPWV